jgi:hypothetical protein
VLAGVDVLLWGYVVLRPRGAEVLKPARIAAEAPVVTRIDDVVVIDHHFRVVRTSRVLR